ncbi:hypothetical protein QFZ30_003181 [Arthrobacter pascens]|uniref:hypothetical protein n=1 Tax=Arthrobacter pascens TaxID=1677 RepID=UPI00279438CE|nr:hypothetical protein [Arthrobacter pascens]MDQ0679799.1 hypothetical protein [Arthrobacter pascens]
MKAQDLARRRVHAAWVAGPLAVALGASAHLVAGEAVPGPWVLLALTALLSMGASMLAHLNVPVWVLFLVSGVVQQLLHLSFAGFSGDGWGGSSGHTHESYVWQQPQPAQALGGHHDIELMLDAHVAAALLTVLIITQSGAVATKTALAMKGLRAGIALKHSKAR